MASALAHRIIGAPAAGAVQISSTQPFTQHLPERTISGDHETVRIDSKSPLAALRARPASEAGDAIDMVAPTLDAYRPRSATLALKGDDITVELAATVKA